MSTKAVRSNQEQEALNGWVFGMSNADVGTDDAVRLSKEDFRGTYEHGFRVWAKLHAAAVKKTGFPTLDLRGAFRTQPSFTRNMRLKREKIARENRVCAYGSTLWGSSPAFCCRSRFLPFRQPVQMDVAAKRVTTVALNVQNSEFTQEWFHGNRNYVAVLALAWSYVLSARWAEVMPGPCVLTYGDQFADCTAEKEWRELDNSTIVVDLGDGASPDELRWWSAVLAEDQGWHASMTFDGEAFVSPWSVRLDFGYRFRLLSDAGRHLSSSLQPASYAEASRFLRRFCVRHSIADQSHAALAVVMFFPSMGRGQMLRLPVSLSNNEEFLRKIPPQPFYSSHDSGVPDRRLLDKLLTLSCYTRGLRPMLLSVFYEPSINCNAVSAWLQGSLAAIHALAVHKPVVLGRMLMERSPNVAITWLGITILGLQERLLKEAGRGQIPIDLHTAAWSGTTQTFLQLPVSSSFTTHVTRADECRLLFLGQAGMHKRLPLVQWKPYGSTPLEDVDLAAIWNHEWFRCSDSEEEVLDSSPGDAGSPASFEKALATLAAKIANTQAKLDRTRSTSRRVRVLSTLYLSFGYLVYTIVLVLVVGWKNMGPWEWSGVAGGPVAIYAVRTVSDAYFTFRIDSLAAKLKEQQNERAKTIQKLKDATKYDSTLQLLEKYGGSSEGKPGKGKGHKALDGDDNGSGQGSSPGGQQQKRAGTGTGTPNRTNRLPPPTANIPRVGGSSGGVFTPLSSIPRAGGGEGATPVPPVGGSDGGPAAYVPDPDVSAEFAPNAFGPDATSSPPSPPGRIAGGPYPSTAAASAVLPETHWYDRILDLLMGDDETAAKNRIVLLCSVCRLVNGQAPPGTRSLAEVGSWRCMGCGALNGEAAEAKKIVNEVLGETQGQAGRGPRRGKGAATVVTDSDRSSGAESGPDEEGEEDDTSSDSAADEDPQAVPASPRKAAAGGEGVRKRGKKHR
ncbi:hypothetical protein SPI_04747 [Niveomyces insectorum RCEF 264]|uniref:Endoplasmic reticulum junction formation protein lunapark n=1 Tax=Niveomyces insectorum RCEF 264 TaxID=1081102 RepID=A0A167UT86_9HYPO|nr:hypothetical protein SPI_04747 [Niveomyces insectorum RCEF 264]